MKVLTAFGYERIAVGTSIVSLTPSKYTFSGGVVADIANITLEGGDVRIRWDGGDPSATEGHLFAADEIRVLSGKNSIKDFKAIKVSGIPVLHATYEIG